MITHAVLCPSAPLLLPELAGADRDAAAVREATETALRWLVDARPDLVAVVGVADRTASWPAHARADITRYGLAGPSPAATAPPTVGLAALLLDRVGYQGRLALQTVRHDAVREQCLALAADLAALADRVGLVVVADGSARRTLKAPGYLDPRAEPYDAAVEAAVRAGQLDDLARLDPALAEELMAPGWAALQVLAGAFAGVRPQSTVRYAEAPFGVGYLVATLHR
jgi:hypothetical protein